jgi:hypothetical protein
VAPSPTLAEQEKLLVDGLYTGALGEHDTDMLGVA